ncbi:histidine--tRNA ligase, cytoplasmic [Rhododendron vialii]|uniref:histidine--tRNA ligase, cytoplasmic n=1 Tax=Rhododendron vialii TaxID=182163 RepID=UPI00265ED182|nr:histidine--tRNA ligase, cytoplasmic [Rhododendron vialii]
MAVEGREVTVIAVGGKGASLSSHSVFAIANNLAQVRIDSSSLDRLSNQKNNKNQQPPPPAKFTFSLLKNLSPQEARASLLLLLNKLLLSSSASSAGIRPHLPLLISDTLNNSNYNNNPNPSASQTLDFDHAYDVTNEELLVLEKSSLFILDGICAILDHQSSALSSIVDAVAALSCEASGADVSAFSSIDSGDGSSANKDEIAVASDLKVFLNGSKLLGKLECEAVSEIPQLHGTLREIARLVHSRTRVELNSPVVFAKVGNKVSASAGTAKALATAFLTLSEALRHLGNCSWTRAKLSIDAISNVDLRSSLMEMFNRECPRADSLGNLFLSSSKASFGGQYITFFHELNGLSEMVRKIVYWEAITAFVSLEGSEIIDKVQGNAPVEMNVKSDKKSEKKKKVLGKGTTVLMQFIRGKLRSGVGEAVDPSALLEKWVQDLLSLLDPTHSDLGTLLLKVKEIVESNESRRLPKLPKGTRDFAKEQMAIREKAFSIIMEVFKRHGAMALDTPAFELRETLMGKYGEDSKLIYDLADQGGELCSLRYDLTVPFARYVAMNGITSFKRYQIAKVYRRDNPSKGRYREFYQCDFDIAGQYETMGPDFEVVKVMTELLDELNIGDYEIKLNHRKLLDGMLDICGVSSDKFRTICSSIDKLDKQSFEQIRKEMVEEKGLTVLIADKIGTFVKERGSPLELLSKLKQEGSEFLKNEGSRMALNELEVLFKALEKSKCIGKVVFDLSLARGLDYYTGVIFEAVFKGATQVGSIAAGGRYDNLIGMFGTKQVPAVGVSLGIERVFTIMEQLHKEQNQVTRATETQVLVALLGDDLSLAAELVSELWRARVKAEYMVSKRVMKHIERAKASRIPLMVIVGEREVNEGVVKLKDVEAATEDEIRREILVEELQRRLSGGISPREISF